MFNCATMHCKKNSEKIEGMASWLILGVVIPLAIALVVQHDSSLTFDGYLTLERYPYIWAILMGIASLLVKRTSFIWRIIVASGAIGFLMICIDAFAHPSPDSGSAAIWSLFALWIITKQYRCDMEHAKK